MESVLTMPASQFFVMMEAKQSIESKELIHQCYISRAANLPENDFYELVSFFSHYKKEPEVIEEVPKEPLRGEDALSAVRSAFLKDIRLHRDVVH